MAKHPTSFTELLRKTSGNRVEIMIWGLSEATASGKVVSVLFLSLGQAANIIG